jgi:regulator of RNase E activity RraA
VTGPVTANEEARMTSPADPFNAALLEELGSFSTPAVLNGLKQLGVPPERIESADRTAVSAGAPALGPRVGFAATRVVATRRSGPPPDPATTLRLNEEADRRLAELGGPAFLVVQNIGDWRGPVCVWGEVTARLNVGLGAVAGLTNGPVRDLEEMEAVGFPTFSGGPAVGGGYVDQVAVGGPVTVAGLSVEPGDLLHADRHGVLKVPRELAARLPDAIRAHGAVERRVIAVCESPEYSARAFLEAWSTKEP